MFDYIVGKLRMHDIHALAWEEVLEYVVDFVYFIYLLCFVL